jgi:F-type H+-transporting ATPase subunit b
MIRKSLHLTILLALASVTPAFAQEGGLLDINEGLMVWTIVIFVLVLAILYRFAFPHILGAVEAREQQIRDLLAAAAKNRMDAQQALEENNRQLEETRARVQELVAEGRSAGEHTRDEIIAEARRQADEIVTRARRDVRQELDRARQELHVEAVDLAIAAASKLVERNLDEEDNRRLVRSFLADLQTEQPAAVAAGV